MASGGHNVRLRHARWGACTLVRVEGTDWVVRLDSTGKIFRFPSEARKAFDVVETTARPAHFEEPRSPQSTASRHLRRVIESLRIGLPSLDGTTRHFAVGFKQTANHITNLLTDVDASGGAAMIIKGGYGEGKTFAMSILEDVAVEDGFLVARTEIDATENRLNKPHHIYRDLMRNLRQPGTDEVGVQALAAAADTLVRKHVSGNHSWHRREWLTKHLGCDSLAWLLSDPMVTSKPSLLGLLECDPNYPAGRARPTHVLGAVPRDWPAFSAGTQGDFASYVLSGVGRLARLLGHKGFIIILDEMEKWQDLNWNEQTQAGNLLGGLIWGASAEKGKRTSRQRPYALVHSGRCGGYPFTTRKRCHIGIAIAMTPRGDADPEHEWCQYGPLKVAYLPQLTPAKLSQYSTRVAAQYAQAYGVRSPTDDELVQIAQEATNMWRRGVDHTMRSGVQSVIAALDHWRDHNSTHAVSEL